VSEMLFDFPHRSIYSIHHPELHGLHGSTTLSSLPSDLRRGRVNVAPQRPGTTLHAVIGYWSDGNLYPSGFLPAATLEKGWSGDLYLTPETNLYSWGGVGLHTAREGLLFDWKSPMFRVFGDEIVVSNDPEPSPAAHRVGLGGTIAIGEAPLHPETFVSTNGTTFRILAALAGPAAELAVDAAADFTYELRDGAGTLLREGTASDAVELGDPGAYRASMRMKTGQQISLVFDTSRPDYNPPSLTSLRVVDAGGRVVSRLANASAATLLFSAVDAIGNRRDSTELQTTRVSWRTAGGPWHDLPLTMTLVDRGDPAELGHYETGIHYRADLGPLTYVVTDSIDLRIELQDASGNTSTSTFEYPLTDGNRRRAVGK